MLGLKKNLLSLGRFDELGYKYSDEKGCLKVSKEAPIVMKTKNCEHNLYKLIGETIIQEVAVATTGAMDLVTSWHQRLGHMSERGLKILLNRNLLPGLKSLDLCFCEQSLFGKWNSLQFARCTTRCSIFLQLLHLDCFGPAPVASLGGSLYFVSFIDDYSCKVWVFLVKKKSDALDCFKKLKALIEKQMGKSIKCLRTDNGREFCSKEFD